jgi:hypothetical protein
MASDSTCRCQPIIGASRGWDVVSTSISDRPVKRGTGPKGWAAGQANRQRCDTPQRGPLYGWATGRALIRSPSPIWKDLVKGCGYRVPGGGGPGREAPKGNLDARSVPPKLVPAGVTGVTPLGQLQARSITGCLSGPTAPRRRAGERRAEHWRRAHYQGREAERTSVLTESTAAVVGAIDNARERPWGRSPRHCPEGTGPTAFARCRREHQPARARS